MSDPLYLRVRSRSEHAGLVECWFDGKWPLAAGSGVEKSGERSLRSALEEPEAPEQVYILEEVLCSRPLFVPIICLLQPPELVPVACRHLPSRVS